MRVFRLLAIPLAAGITLATGAPAQAGLLINIDKSAQELTVTLDGVVRYRWPVSTGRAGYATPAGSFQPFRMEEDHYSKEWDDAPMPHSIFFTRIGHAIHGSFETKKLGSPASAGCVRLAPENAAVLFALVKDVGLNKSKVEIGGTEPPPAVARRGAPRDARPSAATSPAAVSPDPYAARVAPDPYAERIPSDPYQRLPPDAYAERMQPRIIQEEPPRPTHERPAWLDPRYPYNPPRVIPPRAAYPYGGR